MATSRRLRVRATTGVASSAYGGNLYLQLGAVSAGRNLLSERLLSAATYRAAAAVEEQIGNKSNCAVCVDALEGRIHLEFCDGTPRTEQDAAEAVLRSLVEKINRSH
jgi:hypothetical protein